MDSTILSYIEHGDIIIAKDVCEKLTLINFPIDEFLDEVDSIWYEWQDYESSIRLLNMAKLKLSHSGESASTEEYHCDDMILLIEEKIFEIEYDIEKILKDLDYNYRDNLNSDDKFCYGGDNNSLINIGSWQFIYKVEHRLIDEGFFNDSGNWIRSDRDLAILIDIYNNNGILKRRDIKGRWFDLSDYLCFFESRYCPPYENPFNLYEAYKNLEYEQSEIDEIFPWIGQYLKKIKG